MSSKAIDNLPTCDRPTSLTPQALHDELRAHIEENKDLKHLLPLLEAAFHLDKDLSEDCRNALNAIKHENDRYDLKREDHVSISMTPSKDIFEADGKTGVLSHDKESEFKNWGLTVCHTASRLFQPRTIEGVKNVVKWAGKHGKRVRCAGFRHTWSDLYGGEGDAIMMFQPLSSLTKLPYEAPPKSWKSELQGVSIVGEAPSSGHTFVKIMAGTTNEYFREWCFENKTVCIPFNVIMVEVTFGGTNAPICHGAGLSSKTLSDLVVEMTYVDPAGELQTISDKEELRAASGCFGLLGVVVSLTLRLDKMARAELAPEKQHYVLAIPPPKGYPIPKQVQAEIDQMKFTEEDLDEARVRFERRSEEDYYVEWFWFPYQRYVWTNTWKKYEITDNAPLKAYPGDKVLTGVQAQWDEGVLAECIVDWWAWKNLGGYQQAFLFGLATLSALPNVTDANDKIETYVSEALHFRRGIQNFRVWDTEWEIPIPAKADGKRNFEIVQRAWWDGISAIYSRPDAPVRVALEMRLTGGSDVLLAPQRGNTLGTASIEVLTALTTPENEWKTFCQQVADAWTDTRFYKDLDGKPLNVRPHWAKQWEGLNVRGKSVDRYLREDAYKDEFREFKEVMEGIMSRRGSTLHDARARFGNQVLERFVLAV